MKSTFNLVSVCAIAMLLLSNAAFGVILDDYYSDGACSVNAVYDDSYDDSSVAATANSTYTSSWAVAGGTDAYYTTEDGTFSWTADLDVWAVASVTVADGSPDASGRADAYADMPYNWRSFSRHAYAYDNTGVTDEDYGSLSVGDTGTFYAYTGVNCHHEVYVSTHASAYSSNTATAGATATADAYMW
jgi:hypothetical protein